MVWDWRRKSRACKNRGRLLSDMESLRRCATMLNTKNETNWALAFIVRHKQYDRRDAHDALGAMFDLRHQLVDLSDEKSVIWVEEGLPLKKPELNAGQLTKLAFSGFSG